MPYDVRIEQLPPCPTAVVRLRARQDELSRVVPDACGEVWRVLGASGVAKGGRHVAVYLDCEINLEVGALVDRPFSSDGPVVCSSTPAGSAATVAHFGPYDRLGEAHRALTDWCAAHGYSLAGPSWEVYGHWDDDPSRLRTDIYYLITSS
jgi:effector-binding domain-containing protein